MMEIGLIEFPYGNHFNEEIKHFFKVCVINYLQMCVFNVLKDISNSFYLFYNTCLEM